MNRKIPNLGILGGGPAGLSLSLLLQGKAEVLERERHPGGHAASFRLDGFTFDYGPHIMFSKDQGTLDFMVRSLGRNFHRCRRNNKVWFKDRLLKYPFENDLKSLPLRDNYECLRDFLFNPHQGRPPANLREWLLAKFGEGICSRYLFPYNEKVWNLPVEKLSMSWADRIPDPNPQDVLKSSLGYATEGYLHQLHYHYPRRGGYQALSEAWAGRVPVTYGFEARRVRRIRGGFEVSSDSERRRYRSLACSLPVQELARMLEWPIPPRVRTAIARLRVNPMVIVSLGIKGEDRSKYTAIYFPEKELLFNRISYPGTFSPLNCPAGTHSIQAEITMLPDSGTWRKPDEELVEHVVAGLLRRGLIRSRKSIVLADLKRRRYSYVVYDAGFEANVDLVRRWFESQGIWLIGRFGYVEYVNVDGIVRRSLEVARRIKGGAISLADC